MRLFKTGFTPSLLTWIAIGLVALVVGVTLEIVAFARTGNRLVEAFLAISTALPIGLVVLPNIHRNAYGPVAAEASWYRVSAIMQLVLACIFALNLALQLTMKPPGTGKLHDYDIAMFFLLIAISPFSYFLMRRRYLIAKAALDAGPPDRWTAYKETLARGG